MVHAQEFGGKHTEEKLNALEKYLSSYVKVMKNQVFTTHYIDAFAGSGGSQKKIRQIAMQSNFDFDLSEHQKFVTGSPIRAINITPSFDRYIFIEKNEINAQSLRKLGTSHPEKDINVIQGDANDALQKFAMWLRNRKLDRAVVFLDPFGLSVKWETIKILGETEKVDLWYLVPVHAMNRQIKRDGSFLPSANKIDELWGSTEWRNEAVSTRPDELDLFGGTYTTTSKLAQSKLLSDLFKDRLSEAFKGGVSKSYLKLGHGSHHMFSLMFACANPSPAAFSAALRIANDAMKK